MTLVTNAEVDKETKYWKTNKSMRAQSNIGTLLSGSIIFVSPLAIKLLFIHSVASVIFSLVASIKDGENIDISSLKAIMLKESSGESFEMVVDKVIVMLSMGCPHMLSLLSTTKTTWFLKAFWRFDKKPH